MTSTDFPGFIQYQLAVGRFCCLPLIFLSYKLLPDPIFPTVQGVVSSLIPGLPTVEIVEVFDCVTEVWSQAAQEPSTGHLNNYHRT